MTESILIEGKKTEKIGPSTYPWVSHIGKGVKPYTKSALDNTA